MRLTQRKLLLGLLAVPTILLIGMGIAFGWATPANSYYHLGGSLVMATLVGMGIFCSALMNETVGNKDGDAK